MALDSKSVSLLVQKGADINLLDRSGCSARAHLNIHPSPWLNYFSVKGKIKYALRDSATVSPIPQSSRTRSFVELLGSQKAPSKLVDGLLILGLGVTFCLTWLTAMSKEPVHGLFIIVLVVCCFIAYKYFKHTVNVYRFKPCQDENKIKINMSVGSTSLTFLSTLFNFGFKELQLTCQQLNIEQIQLKAKKILYFPLFTAVMTALLILFANLTEHRFLLLIFFLLAFLSFTVGILLERVRRRSALADIYNQLDDKAEALMQQSLKTPANIQGSQSTVLYLRAFETTGKLAVKGVDLEMAIGRFLSPLTLLVTFGLPGEYYGAARIHSTEEQWREKVTALMGSSDVILMIPSDRPGTVWEAQKIKELQLLKKTVFVMPPNIDFQGGQFAEYWNRACSLFESASLFLPPHAHKGLIFNLTPDGYLRDFSPLEEMDTFINMLDNDLLRKESFESRSNTDTDDIDNYHFESYDDY